MDHKGERGGRINWKIGIDGYTTMCRTSPMAKQVKNLPATQETQETWVQSLGREDPLEREMATTPVFLTEKSHGQRILAGYHPMSHKELDMTE